MYIMLSNILTFSKAVKWASTVLLVGSHGMNAWAQSPAPDSSASALLAKHTSLASALATNAYGRPLVLDSAEAGNLVSGNAYAVLDAPFASVSTAFRSANTWCDVMILHINTKYCRVISGSNPAMLKVHIGKKTPQTLQDSFPLEFVMRQVSTSASLLVVQLNAEKGPLGTSNYRIELQAVPIEGNKTFMHLRYAYEYGMAGKLAMQGYLATGGRGKVGFSIKTPATANAKATYVGGARGAVERNTMRYYLAIDAYLQALPLPPAQQVNARLEKWFDATEQFPQQLREADKPSYMAMKKIEIQRQQAATPAR
jgi:hypothetical protein